ncbi:MAG TPA: cytochrome c biogenesis protein ResB [Verrucomicrobiae bacterium]|jgi:hypothetical protein|nr:cytochrome c biogenesis protein ResB [Verrucomicrobiae bacterium]
MIHRFISFISSLRLTVVCLCLAIALVFTGTIAQVYWGLYTVQSDFFRSFFVYWRPSGSGLKIPLLPGGWLLGSVLLINLLAAHIKRFKWTAKKTGIFMIHGGLVLLLVGQFFTELFQRESSMRIEVGQTKNYSEDNRKNELAIVDVTDPQKDMVVAIPESMVAQGGEIKAPALPFTIQVEKYLPNSTPAGPMSGGADKLKSADGIGQRLLFTAAARAARMDDEDRPAALVRLVSERGPIGEWIVSTWLSKYPYPQNLEENLGSLLGVSLSQPQQFTYGGRTYQIALRPIRYYEPYSVSLIEFKHEVYDGTDIPKNFASRVHLNNPSTGEDRDILIYMNNPLRYHGETFFQASFEPDDKGTILQVVKNPASPTPYIACLVIGFGLLVQFLMHLYTFATRRRPQAPAPAARRPLQKEPV